MISKGLWREEEQPTVQGGSERWMSIGICVTWALVTSESGARSAGCQVVKEQWPGVWRKQAWQQELVEVAEEGSLFGAAERGKGGGAETEVQESGDWGEWGLVEWKDGLENRTLFPRREVKGEEAG